MPIDPQSLATAELTDISVEYDERDVMLYALGVGLGREPELSGDLAYVSEHAGLRTLPTFVNMLVPDSIVIQSGCDVVQLLHRTQSLEIVRPLPASGRLLANQKVLALADRGAGIGAEIELETELRMARDDTVVCTANSRVFARGDGGFGGPAAPKRTRHRLPDREPDLVCDLATRPDQALLFRLSGDMNPLHVDPASARSAGFERPILHGRCTQGIACHAILKTVCNYDFTLIAGFDVRFSSPVFPGDVITTEMWQDGNVVSFRCKVTERDVTVINNGRCTLRG